VNENISFPNATRFHQALKRFDEENSHDPNVVMENGTPQPRELIYAQWLTDWVLRLCPNASEELRLAARCQHLGRWMIPRDSFPMTKPGYLKWRQQLKQLHAENSGRILRELGYPDEMIQRVQHLNLKINFPADPDSRVLEDALCLVFLERQLTELAAKSTEQKVINALQKSWAKMTPTGQALALKIPYPPFEKALLEKALAPA
jgi:hypothetical protein